MASASGRDNLCFRGVIFIAFGIKNVGGSGSGGAVYTGDSEMSPRGTQQGFQGLFVLSSALWCCYGKRKGNSSAASLTLPLLPGHSPVALRGFVAAQGELSLCRGESMSRHCSLSLGLCPDVLAQLEQL